MTHTFSSTQPIFTKDELLARLGTREATKSRPVRFHYFDSAKKAYGGFAQVRFEHGGKTIIAEASFWGNQDPERGEQAHKPQIFELVARQNWMSGDFTLSSLVVDGETYDVSQPGMIELGFSVFQSRLLELQTLAAEKMQKTTYDATQGQLFKDALDQVFSPQRSDKARAIHRNMPLMSFDKKVTRFDGKGVTNAVAQQG